MSYNYLPFGAYWAILQKKRNDMIESLHFKPLFIARVVLLLEIHVFRWDIILKISNRGLIFLRGSWYASSDVGFS